MQDRNQLLTNIRTSVKFHDIHSNSNQIFQDKCLRPILMFQHELIISLYDDFIITNKIDFKDFTKKQRETNIEHSIKNNQNLQSLIKGIIIGHFNTDEIEYWLQNKSEINKRIVQLSIKRIQSVFAP
jgi:hypothetical protein